MDYNIETEFVKKYVKKEYQERLLFELQSKKHREKAISRFSHFSTTILKNTFNSCDIIELKNHLCRLHNLKEKCYIVSNDENDGLMLFISDAIEYCANSYLTMILISEKIVVVKEEYEKKPVILIST